MFKMIYEVKAVNTTIEWTTSKAEAMSVFDKAKSSARLFELNPETGRKVLLGIRAQ